MIDRQIGDPLHEHHLPKLQPGSPGYLFSLATPQWACLKIGVGTFDFGGSEGTLKGTFLCWVGGTLKKTHQIGPPQINKCGSPCTFPLYASQTRYPQKRQTGSRESKANGGKWGLPQDGGFPFRLQIKLGGSCWLSMCELCVFGYHLSLDSSLGCSTRKKPFDAWLERFGLGSQL